LQESRDTLTFFETPHRMEQTLAEVPLYFGGRPILIAREITKRHQELLRFDDAASIGRMPTLKGEFTIVIGPSVPASVVAEAVPDELIYNDFCRMTLVGAGGRRATLSLVAQKYGRSAKDVYAIVERFKKSDADRA